MISSQFVSMCLRGCAIQFHPYCMQPLMQIDHKVLNWRGDSSLNTIGIPIRCMKTLTCFYELRCPTLVVRIRSTESNICMHDRLQQATIPAK